MAKPDTAKRALLERATISLAVAAVPDWVTADLAVKSAQAWLRYTPTRGRVAHVPGSITDPFATALEWQRRIRTGYDLAEDLKVEARAIEALVKAGDLTFDAAENLIGEGLDRTLLQLAQLGAGRDDVWVDRQAMRLLDDLREQQRARIADLWERQRTGEISQAQARAWAESGNRGTVRAAQMAGATANIGDDGVRWVMNPAKAEAHCSDCPNYAQTYPDLDTMLAETGGLPGASASECRGNCWCSIEPQRLASVFEDTGDSLVRRGGRALALVP